MTLLRERLRLAREVFAESISELIQREVRLELERRAAHEADKSVDEVAQYIKGRPGSMPKDVALALGMNRASVLDALERGCAAGTLQKTGRGRGVRYSCKGDEKAQLPQAKVPHRVASPRRKREVPPDGDTPSPIEPALVSSDSGLVIGRVDKGEPESPKQSLADALLLELETVLAGDIQGLPVFARLQAIVAEVRHLKVELPADDPLVGLLDRALQTVATFRSANGLPFIVGLKRDAETDWEAMGKKWRARSLSPSQHENSRRKPRRASPPDGEHARG